MIASNDSEWKVVAPKPRKERPAREVTKPVQQVASAKPKQQIRRRRTPQPVSNEPIMEISIPKPKNSGNSKPKKKTSSPATLNDPPAAHLPLMEAISSLDLPSLLSKLSSLSSTFSVKDVAEDRRNNILIGRGKLLCDHLLDFFKLSELPSSCTGTSSSDFGSFYSLPASIIPPSVIEPIFSAFECFSAESVEILLNTFIDAFLSKTNHKVNINSKNIVGLMLAIQCLISKFPDQSVLIFDRFLRQDSIKCDPHSVWLLSQCLLLPLNLLYPLFISHLIPKYLSAPVSIENPFTVVICRLGTLIFSKSLEVSELQFKIPKTCFQIVYETFYSQNTCENLRILIAEWFYQFEQFALFTRVPSDLIDVLLSFVIIQGSTREDFRVRAHVLHIIHKVLFSFPSLLNNFESLYIQRLMEINVILAELCNKLASRKETMIPYTVPISNEDGRSTLLRTHQFNYSGVQQCLLKLYTSEWKSLKKELKVFVKKLIKRFNSMNTSQLNEESQSMLQSNLMFLQSSLELLSISFTKTAFKLVPVALLLTSGVLYFFYRDVVFEAIPALRDFKFN
ncbi:hypothetical protein RCL1_002403 [Eukaryota sp. TZLM3-RCL]